MYPSYPGSDAVDPSSIDVDDGAAAAGNSSYSMDNENVTTTSRVYSPTSTNFISNVYDELP